MPAISALPSQLTFASGAGSTSTPVEPATTTHASPGSHASQGSHGAGTVIGFGVGGAFLGAILLGVGARSLFAPVLGGFAGGILGLIAGGTLAIWDATHQGPNAPT